MPRSRVDAPGAVATYVRDICFHVDVSVILVWVVPTRLLPLNSCTCIVTWLLVESERTQAETVYVPAAVRAIQFGESFSSAVTGLLLELKILAAQDPEWPPDVRVRVRPEPSACQPLVLVSNPGFPTRSMAGALTWTCEVADEASPAVSVTVTFTV